MLCNPVPNHDRRPLTPPDTSEDPLIRSVLPLTAGPGTAEQLESFYRERGILDRARRFPGCLDSTMWRTVPTPGTAAAPGSPDRSYTHLVFADWSTPADYLAWVADPWRATVADDVGPLLDVRPSRVVGVLLEPVPDDRA